MSQDLLESYLDAVEGGALDEQQRLAVLRDLVSQDAAAFHALEPLYKRLRSDAECLAELTRTCGESRRAHEFRGLKYLAERDARVRAWALEQPEIDTRPFLTLLEQARAVRREELRGRVHRYVRAEARLRFEVLNALATVHEWLKRSDQPSPGAAPFREPAAAGAEMPPPAVPWRRFAVVALGSGLAGGLLAGGLGFSAYEGLLSAVAAACVPFMFVPSSHRRAWDRYLARVARESVARAETEILPSLAELSDATAVAAVPPARRRAPTALSIALERALASPTAEQIASLLKALDALLEKPHAAHAARRMAANGGGNGSAEPLSGWDRLAQSRRALGEAFETARLPWLLPATLPAFRFVLAFVEHVGELRSLRTIHDRAADAGVSMPFPPPPLEASDEGLEPRSVLGDAALDELGAVLERLDARPESAALGADGIRRVRTALGLMGAETQRQVESATCDVLAACCGRWAADVASWCERISERVEVATLEVDGRERDDELLAKLDDLAFQVRAAEAAAEEARRDVASTGTVAVRNLWSEGADERDERGGRTG